MKLLQINVAGNTGSTGRIAESIGIMAIQKGWESYIACSRIPTLSESKLIRIGSYVDTLIHGLHTRLFDRHCLGSKQATQKFISEIRKINPDLIHLHNLHGYYINIEILFNFLSELKKPVIWTFHDCWPITGHCVYFDYANCEKWKTGCFACSQKTEYPASYFYDRSIKNYRLKKKLFTSVKDMTIVTVSKWLKNVVSASFMGHIDIQVINNGIDTDLFNPDVDSKDIKDRYGIGNRFMIMGLASQWCIRKGFDDFISLSKVLNDDCVIVLIGLEKDKLKILPKNIIGLPTTENQKQLKDFYATADLFFNASVEETFGLTTAEALSCGTPAIVYNATACPEIIDKSTGFVVTKNDIIGVIHAIETVKAKGKKSFGDACRQRALNRYKQDDFFKEYLALYENKL